MYTFVICAVIFCPTYWPLFLWTAVLPIVSASVIVNTGCKNAYEFPCSRSVDENNRTICLQRFLHCNGSKECPNGEDEEDCHDLHGTLMEKQNELARKLNYSEHIHTNYLTNIIHENCTIAELSLGKCGCDLSHPYKVLCSGKQYEQIPANLSTGIHVLNLDESRIKFIDPPIMNRYWNLTTLSLKYNLISSINNETFSELSRLRRLYLIGNQITHVDEHAFTHLLELEYLELQNNHLTHIDASKLFQGLLNLKSLYLSDNKLKNIGKFTELPSLAWIDLAGNKLTKITDNFTNLHGIETLILGQNRITQISRDAFTFKMELVELDFSFNLIRKLDPLIFEGLYSLRKLNMSYNLVQDLPRNIFSPLNKLESLDLSGINIHNIHPDHFSKLFNLRHAYFWKFRYCTYVPHVRICRPVSDGFSSLQHLLLYPILRIFIWIVAGITCIGNSVVIAWRSMAKKEHQTLSLLVKNLALADLIMGIYLVIIGSYDISFRDEYNNHALKWMNSWQCNLCGFLATFSSELSIFIVLLITIERYRSITLTCRFVSLRYTPTLISFIWLTAFSVALFPIIYWSHPDDPMYYSSNGMCFPLHVEDIYMSGWQFSAFIFLGLNFPVVILIITFYARLFWIIKRDRELTRPALLGHVEHEDVILAFRIFCIVATDCMSWLPIVFLKLIAFTSFPVSPKIYAWFVVFILPINSALNPLIYTIAAPTEFRRRLNKYLRRARKRLITAVGIKSERFLRDHVSSSMSSHVTGSLEHTRSSNCSVMSNNIPLTTSNLLMSSNSERSHDM
ncbi:uncharacterized protein LOC141851766 [Brevipalpus obovatus]|uniref:uncharacterized protein LOC141851766 n=1 Tax=Brevipalpus obovatus TaxID=246614 RepID=UPI003D9F0CD9